MRYQETNNTATAVAVDQTNFQKSFSCPLENIQKTQGAFNEASIELLCSNIDGFLLTKIPVNHAILRTAAFQVLMKLTQEFVKNALDAKSTTLYITLCFNAEEGRTDITLRDNGEGFTNGNYPTDSYVVYDYESALLNLSPKKEQRAQNPQIYGGANLGLAIADHYLSTYGNGNLLMKNRRPKGACIVLFSNNLPCTKQINLCNVSSEPYYLDEMIASLKDSILNTMQSRYHRSFSISNENFNRIRQDVLRTYAFERTREFEESPETNLMAKIIRAILLETARPVSRSALFHHNAPGTTLPGTKRPKPIFHPDEPIPDETKWTYNELNRLFPLAPLTWKPLNELQKLFPNQPSEWQPHLSRTK